MSSETSKLFDIRRREGFFQKYIQNLVIDIGSGPHGVSDECERFDITLGNGDATYMEGVPDEHFDTVYCTPGHHMVTSPDGDVAIKDICDGDMVLGASGWVRVNETLKFSYRKPLVRFNCSDKFVEVTGNHPIATPHGWVYADKLRDGNEGIRVAPKIQTPDFIKRVHVRFCVRSPATLGPSFSGLIPDALSPSAKRNYNISLTAFPNQVRSNPAQQSEHSVKSAVDAYAPRRLSPALGVSVPRDISSATGDSVLGQNANAFFQNVFVAVGNIDYCRQALVAGYGNADASLSVDYSRKPCPFTTFRIHNVVNVPFNGTVYNIKTDDGTFFLNGVLTHNSSHLLEHLELPVIALRNWWRVLKTGGFLVVDVPSRKYYEKTQHLPSRWNSDHKHFFNPIHGEPPDTLGLLDTFEEAVGPRYELEHLRVFHDGCDNWMFPMEHSHGLYTIELTAKKI